MPTIPISEITISDRQRKEAGLSKDEIEKLAKSISDYGLIHPILINDADKSLVAGFRRIMAHLHLGREEIPYTTRDDLSETEKKEIELEENLHRVDLEWWETNAAIAEIHELKKDTDPTWSVRKTAAITGKSTGKVSESIQLHEEIKKDPELKKEKSQTSALRKLKTKKQLEKRKQDIALKAEGKIPSIAAKIITGDALELIRDQEDESFDAIVTNPPFGIDLELKGGKKVYEDDEDYIVELVQQVAMESYRVLRDDSWFVAWFDMRKITYSTYQLKWYKAFMQEIFPKIHKILSEEEAALADKWLYDSMGLAFWLEQAGFDYVTVNPPIWVKPNKTQGVIGDPRKGLITSYEAMVFAAKGDAFFMKQGKQNIFIHDTPLPGERVHELQMPTSLCKEIVSMVSMGGGRILDPFAGSGSIGLGALENQCEFLGFELDEEKAKLGNMRLREHMFSDKEESDEGSEE